jgi:hypothetical protein
MLHDNMSDLHNQTTLHMFHLEENGSVRTYDASLFGREISNISSPVAHVLSLLPRRWCVVGMWEDGSCVDMAFWVWTIHRMSECDNCCRPHRFGTRLIGYRGWGASVLCRKCSR